jgi:transcriptional regulator with XRE-family HTH domain
MYKERIATVTERLNQAMRLRGIRQIDLCKMCNIPKGAMSLYVSGAYEPKQDRLEALANALRVDIAWLMGYDVAISLNNKENSPEEISEGEKEWLDLYRSLPEASRLQLSRSLKAFEMLPEHLQTVALQEFALQMLQAKLNDQ